MLNAFLWTLQWWQETSCKEEHPLIEEWKGTVGVGVGPDGIKDSDEDHQYKNLYV